MTYSERPKNLLMIQFFFQMIDLMLPKQNAMFRKYHGSDFPSLKELVLNSALVMVNGEEMFEFAGPIAHKFIFVGGLGV